MKLQFCGADGTVTGSCHLLVLDDGFRILMDCGMYQGDEPEYRDFNRKFIFDPKSIDVVLLSHAHIDHCGRLPLLVKEGYRNTIWTTPASHDLTSIMLLDSAHIQERESEFTNRHAREDEDREEPLYTSDDVTEAMSLFRTVNYNQWFSIHPDVDVLYKDSGHILGAGSITLRIRRQGLKDTLLGFTADIGRPNRPILRNPDPMPACDFLISESTYGDRLHESQPEEKEHLLKVVRETCVQKNGRLIIPAFSVGRTQEIVYMLNQLSNDGELPDIPIYVDSPLATNATTIFQQHPECFDKQIVQYMLKDPNPFGFNDLIYVRSVEESKKINGMHGVVVISASGMINAGRVKHHVFNAIENPDNAILLVGYASPNTPAGKLIAGNKTIRLFGQTLQVNARIERMDSFSAHGDYREMIEYLRSQDKEKLRRIFLVHGNKHALDAYKGHLEEEGYMDIEIPALGDITDI